MYAAVIIHSAVCFTKCATAHHSYSL